LSVADDVIVKSIWGSSSSGYSFQSSVGASGGLLTMWGKGCVEVLSTSSFAHGLVIRGRVL